MIPDPKPTERPMRIWTIRFLLHDRGHETLTPRRRTVHLTRDQVRDVALALVRQDLPGELVVTSLEVAHVERT